MRSKVPCTACGKSSCPSGFVFKTIPDKCMCKVCYNRQKRFEKVSAFREATTTPEELLPATLAPAPAFVINLEGMSILKYCSESYMNSMKATV